MLFLQVLAGLFGCAFAGQEARVIFEDKAGTAGRDQEGTKQAAKVKEGRPGFVTPSPLPTSLELDVGSTFTAEPNSIGRLLFRVTNNLPSPAEYNFLTRDSAQLVTRVDPQKASLPSGGSLTVTVELEARGDSRARDRVALTAETLPLAQGLGPYFITKRAYFSVGKIGTDSGNPTIDFSYRGDCRDNLRPKTCSAATWGVEVTFQDIGSGLLRVGSEPAGLQLGSEFIAGTKDPLSAIYLASCCNTKVTLFALDTRGNYAYTNVDVEKRWLSSGEIAAIVLGSFLVLLLIAFIIWAIVACCRRRKTSNYYINR